MFEAPLLEEDTEWELIECVYGAYPDLEPPEPLLLLFRPLMSKLIWLLSLFIIPGSTMPLGLLNY